MKFKSRLISDAPACSSGVHLRTQDLGGKRLNSYMTEPWFWTGLKESQGDYHMNYWYQTIDINKFEQSITFLCASWISLYNLEINWILGCMNQSRWNLESPSPNSKNQNFFLFSKISRLEGFWSRNSWDEPKSDSIELDFQVMSAYSTIAFKFIYNHIESTLYIKFNFDNPMHKNGYGKFGVS